MKFIIDEDLPRSMVSLIHKYGHEAIDVRDINLNGAMDESIAKYAQKNNGCLVTGDFDFSDIRNYPPQKYDGIIVLFIPHSVTAMYILNLMESFILHYKQISSIKGKLVIVEPGRIRVRT